jgi:serine/threonine-protein kinase
MAEYRAGHLDEAIRLLGDKSLRAMGPCPKLIVAMAQKDKGDDAAARQTFADGVVRFDWRVAAANARDPWIFHVLRREAEAKVFGNTSTRPLPTTAPPVLNASRQPRDNDERIAMLATCQFQKLNSRCVELFADAQAAEPGLITTRNMNPGFVAASASCALALCQGSSAQPDLPEADRARFRSMACGWLTDDITMQMHKPRPKNSDSRAWLKRELTAWKRDAGLAPLRDPAILRTLTAQQRDEVAGVWKAVDDAIDQLKD